MTGWRYPRSLISIFIAFCQVAGCSSPREEMRQIKIHAVEDKMDLAIDCSPEHAEVIVDGVFQGSCGLLSKNVMHLEAGTHTVLVRASGYREFRSMVSANGMRQSLTAHLDQRP
jgi:PEGA domain-containing protein